VQIILGGEIKNEGPHGQRSEGPDETEKKGTVYAITLTARLSGGPPDRRKQLASQ